MRVRASLTSIAEAGTRGGEVGDQQVADCRRIGHDAELRVDLAETVDHEDDGGDAGLELARGTLLAQLEDVLVGVFGKNAGLEHPRRLLVVDEVGTDHVPERQLPTLLAASCAMPQLRAQLALGAAPVEGAQHVLPETSTRGQDRVVGWEELAVGAGRGQLRAAKMPTDLAARRVEHHGEVGLPCRASCAARPRG